MKKLSKKQMLKKIVDKTILEEKLSEVESDSEKYYSVIEEYGISNKLNDIIDNFPKLESNKSSLYKKNKARIGIICDEFLFYSLKDAADFEYISYSENLTVDISLDMLLVVSSWRGLDHTWDYVANPNGEKRKSLITLIEKYNKESIPTVFYSKEDPISYKEYLSIAKACRYILTSAKEVIEDYKRDTGNSNVDYLEFGVNPMYHNPIGKKLDDKELSNLVTFAGSWMVRFPERNQEALEIFNGINKTNHDLCIIDRQYERKMKRYHFPSYLLSNISATIPHERLMKLHKATTWGINLNSVKDSETMFANRVYELQAMGNVVVSNYNKGVHSKFPHILMAGFSNDVENIFNNISINEKRDLIARGIREVMLNHTAYHRVSKLTSFIGLKTDEINTPNVLVVGSGEKAYSSYKHQTYKNLTYIHRDEFNGKVSYKDYEFICYLSNDKIYEEYYIENLLSAFVYSEADVVTMNNDEYDYSSKENYIEDLSMVKSSIYEQLNEDKSDIKYFNIPVSEVIKRNSEEKLNTKKHLLDIIIPVNNEQNFLEFKSLRSLNHDSIDSKVNIHILNIGEDSEAKSSTLNRVKRKYKNVKIIDVNSDSVQTTILKMFRKLSSPYVMFLKPENEIVSNKLMKVINKNLDSEYDMILSDSYNPVIKQIKAYESDLLTDYYSLNESISGVIFKVSFIQDLLMEENNINEKILVLKSLIKSKSKIHSNLTIHNNFHYVRDTSNLNKKSYLENSLKDEMAIKSLMDENNTLDEYVNKVFIEKFINNYFELFKLSDEKVDTYQTLKNILDLYVSNYDQRNKKFNKLIDLLF